MNLTLGTNLTDELGLQELFAKTTGKYVMHFKAVGLLENPDREDDFITWHYDHCPLEILNTILGSDAKEAYLLLDTPEEVLDHYESWFPKQGQLHEDEAYLYVKIIAISPDGATNISNESSSQSTPS